MIQGATSDPTLEPSISLFLLGVAMNGSFLAVKKWYVEVNTGLPIVSYIRGTTILSYRGLTDMEIAEVSFDMFCDHFEFLTGDAMNVIRNKARRELIALQANIDLQFEELKWKIHGMQVTPRKRMPPPPLSLTDRLRCLTKAVIWNAASLTPIGRRGRERKE